MIKKKKTDVSLSVSSTPFSQIFRSFIATYDSVTSASYVHAVPISLWSFSLSLSAPYTLFFTFFFFCVRFGWVRFLPLFFFFFFSFCPMSPPFFFFSFSFFFFFFLFFSQFFFFFFFLLPPLVINYFFSFLFSLLLVFFIHNINQNCAIYTTHYYKY